MKIGNILLYVPNGLISTLAKTVRTRLIDDDKITNKILNEGMYHFVPNEEVAQKICDSGYLKQASGNFISRTINSYGIVSTACLFAGKPDINNYIKNVTDTNIQNNPYVNPSMVTTAINFKPKQKEDLKNYKTRNISDGVILYEGNCVLDSDCVKIEKMVPDLVRDPNGLPIKNKNNEYSIIFRPATSDETKINPETGKEVGNTKQDYLMAIQEQALNRGYSNSKAKNYINNILDQGKMEGDFTKENIKANGLINIKNLINNIRKRIENARTPKIVNSTQNIINDYKIGIKNPFQDEKFAKFVGGIDSKNGSEKFRNEHSVNFQSKSLKQLKLDETLTQLNNSEIGKYLENKYRTFKENINKGGIHGIDHSNRVLITSAIIAQREGVFENDSDNRKKDILMTAAAYHDIGRITNTGPHSRRSAKKIGKMNLTFSDGRPYTDSDKRLLMAIVDAHEGKPEKIFETARKYGIDNKDLNIASVLSTVLRDADALDRVRLDKVTVTKTVTNLDPRYLKTDTAKQLMIQAYELENLTKHATMENILQHGKDKITNKFDEKYKVDSSQLHPEEIAKTTTINHTKTKGNDGIILE